ncbi:hypothetical protein EII17_07395 [Clostridiales bacterium COT073_COT-073]|nr:hypothetical protein EII17_07395 [Clostridiales bacterium COT073_COT-073]
MYLLEWLEGDKRQVVGIFDSMENGREFMRKVPGYRLEITEEDDFSFEDEWIEYVKLPDIAMIEYKDYQVPISRFSFENDIIVVWIELDHLDAVPLQSKMDSGHCEKRADQKKVATGATRVDAYSINNEEVEDYVTRREVQFKKCVALSQKLGYDISRECFGSEDGEVIFIRKKDAKEKERWHFLTHMDPLFVEMDMEKELPELLKW